MTGLQMEGRKWTETRDALAGIAESALKHDSAGIDIHFLNSQDEMLHTKVGYI
jgi:hypothetical protein